MSKNVFITGGSTGIGLALAKKYVSLGCRVAIFARDEKKWLASELSKNPLTAFYAGSVENKNDIKNAVLHFVKKFGHLHLMIANAGIGNDNKTPIPDFEKSEKILTINVLGTLYSVEAAFESMYQNRKGHIVIISSIAGYAGLSGNAAYCASKAALQKMAETYAIDFDQFGINVTCVNPGFVDTPLTQKNNHKMPYLMSAESAADTIMQAVESKKTWIGFPLPTYGMMVILSLLPRNLYIWLIKKMKISLYQKGSV